MSDIISGIPSIALIPVLLVGFVLLIKGADYFVEGSSMLAKHFKVPSIIVGLTVVAMGTSLPETAVSVTASVANNNEMAISNAIGSNIFNLMVVIGFCAMMVGVNVADETIKRDIPISAFCALLALGLGFLGATGLTDISLGHGDGIIMLIFFAAYIFILVRVALKGRESTEESEENEFSAIKVILCIFLGGAAIALGGNITVETASTIAVRLGMSQTLVGLTIVSIGTSLPELVTSIMAARKNEVDMALGNAVGSNVFNILMVTGLASAISPVNFIIENVIDIVILLIFTLVVWLFAATKKKVGRFEGLIMLLMYAAYAVYIVVR